MLIVYCSEVQKAVDKAGWCQLLQVGSVEGRGEREWTAKKLRNSLGSMDLEDLEETIISWDFKVA